MMNTKIDLWSVREKLSGAQLGDVKNAIDIILTVLLQQTDMISEHDKSLKEFAALPSLAQEMAEVERKAAAEKKAKEEAAAAERAAAEKKAKEEKAEKAAAESARLQAALQAKEEKAEKAAAESARLQAAMQKAAAERKAKEEAEKAAAEKAAAEKAAAEKAVAKKAAAEKAAAEQKAKEKAATDEKFEADKASAQKVAVEKPKRKRSQELTKAEIAELVAAMKDAPFPGRKSDGKTWAVVGGREQGGIVVRRGEPINSQIFPAKLSPGTVIEQIGKKGHRLHYKRIQGEGPDFGWVSIEANGKFLVQEYDDTVDSD